MSEKKYKCPVITKCPPCECGEPLNTDLMHCGIQFYENGTVGDNSGQYWGEWEIINDTAIEITRNLNEIVMAYDMSTGEVFKEPQYNESLIIKDPIHKRTLLVNKEQMQELEEWVDARKVFKKVDC